MCFSIIYRNTSDYVSPNNSDTNVNVLSSDVVIACGMGTGTASEIALALKANKKVILLNNDESSNVFFQDLSQFNVFVINKVVYSIEPTRKILLAVR